MTFLEFYDAHFVSVTIMIAIGTCITMGFIIMILKNIFKKNVKTPWFEIAPDSVKIPESEDMAKTRLLLKRQFEYVDHYIDGVSNTFLSLEREIIQGAIESIFGDATVKVKPKTHIETCLINSSTEEIVQKLKNYVESLLVINHIGTDKEKIKRYAKSHVCQIVAIVKKHNYELYSKVSGNICLDLIPYWKKIGIDDPNAWAEEHLYNVLIGICELRYSDFDDSNDGNNNLMPNL